MPTLPVPVSAIVSEKFRIASEERFLQGIYRLETKRREGYRSARSAHLDGGQGKKQSPYGDRGWGTSASRTGDPGVLDRPFRRVGGLNTPQPPN